MNSNSAAGYQLASDEPVMAIGGFNGTDPAPTLAQFEKYVAEGKIHYFIAGGRRRWSGGGSEDRVEQRRRLTDHVVGRGALHRQDGGRGHGVRPDLFGHLGRRGRVTGASVEQRAVDVQGRRIEGDEADQGHVGVRRADGRHGDARRPAPGDSRTPRSRWPERRRRRRPPRRPPRASGGSRRRASRARPPRRRATPVRPCG